MKNMLFVSVLIFVISCSNPVDPYEDSKEYSSLNVGDMRQFCYPFSEFLTTKYLWIISGKTKRSDGLEVFICDSYNSTNPKYKYTSYYFIKDGYYYSTELEKTNNISYNPYFEQKLAKVYPKEGESWVQYSELAANDTVKYYLTTHFLKEFNTPARNFKDVCQLTSSMIIRNEKLEDSYIYYTKYFGYIGRSNINNPPSLLVVNYMKINGKEIGSYEEMKYNNNANPEFKPKTFVTPFGIKTIGEKL